MVTTVMMAVLFVVTMVTVLVKMVFSMAAATTTTFHFLKVNQIERVVITVRLVSFALTSKVDPGLAESPSLVVRRVLETRLEKNLSVRGSSSLARHVSSHHLKR